MKKITSLSLLLLTGIVLLVGCTKRDYYDEWNDYENDEYGKVVYVSEVNSPYSVIEMHSDGMFGVIYSIDTDVKLWPLFNDVLYGDFEIGGTRKVYNKTLGKTIRIDVDEFFDTKAQAINAVIRREDSKNYTSAFKNNALKIERRATNRISITK